MMGSYALRPKTVDFDNIWKSLKMTISRIINLENVDRRVWNDNFHDVYSLCVSVPDSQSDLLYNKTKECLEAHVQSLFEDIKKVEIADLLFVYYRYWHIYYKGSIILHQLFGYLNKQFVKSRRQSEIDQQYGPLAVITDMDNQIMEIGELALSIWRRLLISPLETDLLHRLLLAIEADRKNETLYSENIVKGVIESFVQVEQYSSHNEGGQLTKLYCETFESHFLIATSEYYTLKASRLLEECNCSQYMEKVLQLIDAENFRSVKYLHSSSYEKVTKLCQDVMISSHKEFLHSVTRDMVRNESVQGLFILVKEFESYVQYRGLKAMEALNGENIAQQFVTNILQVHGEFAHLVNNVFEDNGDFIGALDKDIFAIVSKFTVPQWPTSDAQMVKKYRNGSASLLSSDVIFIRAFQVVVNFKDSSKICPKASEWLARYTDTLLRKSAKGLSESEVDQKLTMTIIIFRYIEDKDIFQKFYSRMLAQRLIHGVSVSMDAEEAMITKLKQACGYEFTSKLSRMFTDIGLSRELTDKYQAISDDGTQSGSVQMQILVLQAGAWPLSSTLQSEFLIPFELQPSIKQFEEFYVTQYNGRKLTWLYNLANAEVRLNYLDKTYQVTLSVLQLAILLCFNDSDRLSVSELSTGTLFPLELLGKLLRTIVDSGLLFVNKKDDLINADTVVKLNTNFTSRRLRFKITAPIIQKQVEKETEQVNATVHQDRKYYMECTIVRVMKTRKVLKHNSLVNEVIDASLGSSIYYVIIERVEENCNDVRTTVRWGIRNDDVIEQTCGRFSPDINFIKKSIETLIDKQYLQRTDQNDEYQYLA